MNILFMCVANSARSQLAEGLAKQILDKSTEIKSAGSHPGILNPYAVQVMKEIDLDISHHYSKSVNELNLEFLESLDYIITLCAEEVCPTYLTKATHLHWPIEDPAGTRGSDEEHLLRFRKARDLIKSKLETFKNTHSALG